MIDTHLRAPFQLRFIDPIASLLHRWKISPNFVTFLAFLSGISTLPLLAFAAPFSAVFFLLLSGYLDTIDGSLARLNGAVSDRGAVYDIVSDRAVEFAVILGLYFVDAESRALPSLLMLGSVLLCITTFLVVGMFSENQGKKSFHYSVGLMERTEAFGFFVALILLPAYFLPLSLVFATLVFLTAVIRLVSF